MAVSWFTNVSEAVAAAKADRKLLFVDIFKPG